MIRNSSVACHLCLRLILELKTAAGKIAARQRFPKVGDMNMSFLLRGPYATSSGCIFLRIRFVVLLERPGIGRQIE